MTSRSLSVVCVALLGFACKDEPSSVDLELAKGQSAEKKSAVKVVTTPVPWGTKLACDALFDPAKVGAELGKEVTIADVSKTSREATAVCQVRLGGTPPSAKEQEKKWLAGGRVLGVLPGDEICQVTVYCAYLFDVEKEKQTCEKEGQTASQEIGSLTCVRTIEAGAAYRYIYSVYDPDTQCKYLINPGPSVAEQEPVAQCARMAVNQVGPAQLKNP